MLRNLGKEFFFEGESFHFTRADGSGFSAFDDGHFGVGPDGAGLSVDPTGKVHINNGSGSAALSIDAPTGDLNIENSKEINVKSKSFHVDTPSGRLNMGVAGISLAPPGLEGGIFIDPDTGTTSLGGFFGASKVDALGRFTRLECATPCIRPGDIDGGVFRRAEFDVPQQGIAAGDLVLENPDHEVFFRNLKSFHALVGENGIAVDEDGVSVGTDKAFAEFTSNGRISILNDNNGVVINPDGTMAVTNDTKVENLNADKLDGKDLSEIQTGTLGDGSVTTPKIADGAVTKAKLSPDVAVLERAAADDPSGTFKQGDLVLDSADKEVVLKGHSLDIYSGKIKVDGESIDDLFNVENSGTGAASYVRNTSPTGKGGVFTTVGGDALYATSGTGSAVWGLSDSTTKPTAWFKNDAVGGVGLHVRGDSTFNSPNFNVDGSVHMKVPTGVGTELNQLRLNPNFVEIGRQDGGFRADNIGEFMGNAKSFVFTGRDGFVGIGNENNSLTMQPSGDMSVNGTTKVINLNADLLDGLNSSAFALADALAAPGSVNNPANPVDWTKLKNVPGGFADGTDDGGTPGPNSITNSMIQNNAVTGPKVAPSSIGGNHLQLPLFMSGSSGSSAGFNLTFNTPAASMLINNLGSGGGLTVQSNNPAAATIQAVNNTGGPALYVSGSVDVPAGVTVYSNAGHTAGVRLDQNGTSWMPFTVSDRASKERFRSVDGVSTLKRLAKVPVTVWNYRAQPGVRHMGPTAQDFYSAFGLGEGPEQLNAVDVNGVALSAIQGLYRLNKAKDAKIKRLEARIARLERLFAKQR